MPDRFRDYGFIDPELTDEDGVVAEGGSMAPDRLLFAYRHGIFPWSGDPVRWHCPDPRAIFASVRLPRKLGKQMRRGRFAVTYDQAFVEVVQACAESHAEGGVWITDTFIEAYAELHRVGHAHSVEVWQDDRLVGGLYGVQLRGLFAGESMFHREDNASKVAFAHLVWHLHVSGVRLLDCQMLTPITYQLGAVLLHRADYLMLLEQAMEIRSRYDGSLWPKEGAPEVAVIAAEKLGAKKSSTS